MDNFICLNEQADALEAGLLQGQSPPTQEDFIAAKIQDYEMVLNSSDLGPNGLPLSPENRASFQKLVELYKNKELDGTKVTYVCNGRVIDGVEDYASLPPGTISDGPAKQMAHHKFPGYR